MGAVLQVKMNVFHVPDACGGRFASKHERFLCAGCMWRVVLQMKMNVFNAPDTCGGRFAGRDKCISCSGYMWGRFAGTCTVNHPPCSVLDFWFPHGTRLMLIV